jgi:mercuric ion binding protein
VRFVLIVAVVALVVIAMLWSRSSKPQSVSPVGSVVDLKVGGMACGACALRVEKIATRMDGVVGATVDRERGAARIVYAATKTNSSAIARAITEAGFRADISQ